MKNKRNVPSVFTRVGFKFRSVQIRFKKTIINKKRKKLPDAFFCLGCFVFSIMMF